MQKKKASLTKQTSDKTARHNPLISVIVPCYDQAQYLKECLDSIMAQTFQDFEVIVVDDGSTDNSLQIMKDYQKKYPDKICIIQQKNQGVVQARNNAIRKAKGYYIFPLDSDDTIDKKCLEKLLEAMEQKKGDIITCRVAYFDKRTGEMPLPPPTKYHMSKSNCLVNTALFRQTDFNSAGGYDPAFGLILEDYDFWCNLLFRHNKKIYRVPEILFFYRIKDKSESRNLQHKAEHKKLVKILRQKYPKMRFYKKIYSFLRNFKFIQTIPAFFCKKKKRVQKIKFLI